MELPIPSADTPRTLPASLRTGIASGYLPCPAPSPHSPIRQTQHTPVLSRSHTPDERRVRPAYGGGPPRPPPRPPAPPWAWPPPPPPPATAVAHSPPQSHKDGYLPTASAPEIPASS